MGIRIEFSFYVVSGSSSAVLALILAFRIGITSLNHKAGDDSVKNGFIIEIFLRQLDKIVDVFRGIFREKTQGDIPEFCMNDRLCICHGHSLLSREGFISIKFSDNNKDTDQDYQNNETESDLILFQRVLLSQQL